MLDCLGPDALKHVLIKSNI